LRDDLYTVLVGVEDGGKAASFKIYVNPLQIWLWIGGVIMALGTLIIVLTPKISPVRVRHSV